MAGKKRFLLGIDWQNGFCKQVVHPDCVDAMSKLAPGEMPPPEVMAKNGEYQQHMMDGELFVAGADRDAKNCARLIRESKPDLIVLTFDSHDGIHCSFPTYYDPQPPFFCFIRINPDATAPKSKRFQGYFPDAPDKVVWEGGTAKDSWSDDHAQYLTDLEVDGRFPHCTWPPHCRVGSNSWSLVDEVLRAAIDWEVSNKRKFLKIPKGNNQRREHFSAARAQIIDKDDPTTDVNANFIQTLMVADEILLTGQALYHCMYNTVWDTANLTSKTKDFKNGAMDDLNNNRKNPFLEKCILLYDPKGEQGCTSPVPGVTIPGQDEFIPNMERLGLQVTTVDQYLS